MPKPAPRAFTPRLIINGTHWQTHGPRLYPVDALGRVIEAGLCVHSQYSKVLVKPIVAATITEATSNLTLRLLPADARAFAQSILLAADVADAVQAELEARHAA